MSAWISLFYLYDPWFFHVLRMSLIIGGIALLYLGNHQPTKTVLHYWL